MICERRAITKLCRSHHFSCQCWSAHCGPGGLGGREKQLPFASRTAASRERGHHESRAHWLHTWKTHWHLHIWTRRRINKKVKNSKGSRRRFWYIIIIHTTRSRPGGISEAAAIKVLFKHHASCAPIQCGCRLNAFRKKKKVETPRSRCRAQFAFDWCTHTPLSAVAYACRYTPTLSRTNNTFSFLTGGYLHNRYMDALFVFGIMRVSIPSFIIGKFYKRVCRRETHSSSRRVKLYVVGKLDAAD